MCSLLCVIQDKGGAEDSSTKEQEGGKDNTPAEGGSDGEEKTERGSEEEVEVPEPLELPPAEDTPTEGEHHEICRPVHCSSNSPY